MKLEFDKYVKNLNRYFELENYVYSNENKEEFIDTLSNLSLQKREIFEENNRILELLIPYEKGRELTEEEYNTLFDFANELYNGFRSKDIAIAFRVHELLLKNAKKKNDVHKIIKEIYYAGITEYYANRYSDISKKYYFLESIDYLDSFHLFDMETKKYFIRCYGNRILYYTNKDVNKTLSYGKEILSFFSFAESLEPELHDFLQPMILSIYKNMATVISLFRTSKNIDLKSANEVLNVALKAYQLRQYNSQISKPSDLITLYTIYAIKYHAKMITIEDLLYELNKLSTPTADQSDSERLECIFTMATYFLEYYFSFGKHLKQYESAVEEKINRALEYIEEFKNDENVLNYDRAIILFLLVSTSRIEFNKIQQIIYHFTIFRHRSTFLHTKMVCMICDILTKALLESNPDYFVGILDRYSLERVLANKNKILSSMQMMASLHDIGKYDCMSYISNSSRKLTDIEFEVIKKHPESGYRILKDNIGCPQEVLDGILYHHVFFNGEGGYPRGLKKIYSNKPLVDILVVADTIDAATDYLGRCYAKKKALAEVVQELVDQSGTRYSPQVVEMFQNPKVFAEIEKSVNFGREDLYYDIYKNYDKNQR